MEPPEKQENQTYSNDLNKITIANSSPTILCRNLSLSRRNASKKFSRQKSVETFQISKELLNRRRWPNEVFHHVRWLVMLLAASGLSIMFIFRYSITVSIVKMVNHTALYMDEHPNEDLNNPNILEFAGKDGEFLWTNFIQSLIINIYYLGYALPQVYLSHLAGKCGANKPIIVSQIVSLVSVALMPSAVYMGWQWLALLRFIMGLGAAACFPVFLGMIDSWFPIAERTRAIALLQFFGIAGLTINPLLTSYFCSYHWSWSFYGTCLIGLFWLILWLIVVRNSPEECWLISQSELTLILSERAYKPESSAAAASIPWKKLFLSRNFYIMISVFSFWDGTTNAFGNMLPTYMRLVMGMDMHTIGQIGTLIQSASLLAAIWPAELLDYLTLKLKWSSYNARISIYCISAAGALITWILPAFIEEGRTLMFAINRSLHAGTELVLFVTIFEEWGPLGLSGTIFSIYNTIGCGLVPLFSCSAGFVFDKMGATFEAWNWLFAWFGFVNTLGFVIFLAVKQTVPNTLSSLKPKEASPA